MIGEVGHLNFGRYICLELRAGYCLQWLPLTGLSGFYRRESLRVALPAEPEPDGKRVRVQSPAHDLKALVIFGGGPWIIFLPRCRRKIIVLAAAGIHLASPKFRTDQLLGLVGVAHSRAVHGIVCGHPAFFNRPAMAIRPVQWLAHSGFNLNRPVNLALSTAGALQPH